MQVRICAKVHILSNLTHQQSLCSDRQWMLAGEETSCSEQQPNSTEETRCSEQQPNSTEETSCSEQQPNSTEALFGGGWFLVSSTPVWAAAW